VSEKTEFKYFYGTEADTYSFYRIPKELIVDDKFKELSNDAKILYGLMLDRMSLSVKNSWFDEEAHVYIYYSMEEVMEHLNCSKNKALKCLAELDTEDGIGLIERVKQGQGKPTIIYVKNFLLDIENVSDSQKREVKSLQKGKSRVAKNGSQDFLKKDVNNTDINNTDYSNTESNLIVLSTSIKQNESVNDSSDKGLDEIDMWNAYMDIIRENIELDILLQNNPYDRQILEGIYELILETVLNQDKSIIIASSKYPKELVKSKFLKLNSSHVEYVLDCLKKNTTKVRNIKKYLLAVLFNAPTTIGGYYQAEVNHDLA
jgi:hypothetical protein